MTPDSPPANPYTWFPVTLTARRRLSPHLIRLTFAGATLRRFGTTRLDQRMKLIFADAHQREEFLAVADWATWWHSTPPEQRPSMRTYTVRFVRPEAGEVDIDFVAHGTTGPASRFALEAPLGTELLLLGPDAEVASQDAIGLAYRPGDAEQVLLIGDETAVPAIANIIDQHTGPGRITAFIEVPTSADALDLPGAAGHTISWLAREGAGSAEAGRAEAGSAGEAGAGAGIDGTAGSGRVAERGSLLTAAVAAWAAAEAVGTGVADQASADGNATTASGTGTAEAPTASGTESAEATRASGTEPEHGSGRTEAEEILWEEAEAAGRRYTWVAADALTVKQIRRILLRHHGFDKRQCTFMGYWKPGVSGN